jgi:hypothetical protein
MLFVTSDEVIPETHQRGHQRGATCAVILGFGVMMFLDNPPRDTRRRSDPGRAAGTAARVPTALPGSAGATPTPSSGST